MSSYTFESTPIKTGKVFLHENRWIVSAPASGRRTAFLAYATFEEALAAHKIFTAPLSFEQFVAHRTRKALVRKEAERRAKAAADPVPAVPLDSASSQPPLTLRYVRSLFIVREDGRLVWKVDKGRRIKAGSLAGSPKAVGIDGFTYDPRRILWLYHIGYLPKKVRSIDGNRSNHRIENLRAF